MEIEAPTDAELVAETLAGDREAFGRLYDRYAALVPIVPKFGWIGCMPFVE